MSCPHPHGPCDLCLTNPSDRFKIMRRAEIEESYMARDGAEHFAGVEHPMISKQ